MPHISLYAVTSYLQVLHKPKSKLHDLVSLLLFLPRICKVLQYMLFDTDEIHSC